MYVNIIFHFSLFEVCLPTTAGWWDVHRGAARTPSRSRDTQPIPGHPADPGTPSRSRDSQLIPGLPADPGTPSRSRDTQPIRGLPADPGTSISSRCPLAVVRRSVVSGAPTGASHSLRYNTGLIANPLDNRVGLDGCCGTDRIGGHFGGVWTFQLQPTPGSSMNSVVTSFALSIVG